MNKELIGPNLSFFDLSSRESLFLPEDVLEGLLVNEKWLSSKFFYDQNGSDLFQKITEVPECYLKKAEIENLDDNLDGISELVGEDSAPIEFGSGPPLKSRMLLGVINPSIYMPLDISKESLLGPTKRLAIELFPPEIKAICVDYTAAFQLPFTLEKNAWDVFLVRV